MKFLETYPQDIKVARAFKPCAPRAFRWLVLGGYGLVALGGLVFFAAGLHLNHLESAKKAEEAKVVEVNNTLEEVRSRGSLAQQAKNRYDDLQNWLRRNYSMTEILNSMFGALPTEARLQELSVEEQGEGRMGLGVKLFAPGEGRLPPLDEFVSKLAVAEINLEERMQAAGNTLELNSTFEVAEKFYPSRKNAPKKTQKGESLEEQL